MKKRLAIALLIFASQISSANPQPIGGVAAQNMYESLEQWHLQSPPEVKVIFSTRNGINFTTLQAYVERGAFYLSCTKAVRSHAIGYSCLQK